MKERSKENNYHSRSFNQLAYILAIDTLNILQHRKTLDKTL